MNKCNKYRGAIHTALLRVLINGVVMGCVLELICLFVFMFFQSDLLYWLYGIFHWPRGFLIGMIMSAGIVLLRWTTVEIRDERIRKRKYWLGSEVSFEAYDRLCKCLEEGMILYPGILRYR